MKQLQPPFIFLKEAPSITDVHDLLQDIDKTLLRRTYMLMMSL